MLCHYIGSMLMDQKLVSPTGVGIVATNAATTAGNATVKYLLNLILISQLQWLIYNS